jgi:hypothetical protein
LAINMSVTSKHPRDSGKPKIPPQRRDSALAEVLEDYAAGYRLLDAGKLAAYAGQYVGIVDGAVVGAGEDAASLREQVARDRKLHPERIAVIHIFDEALAQG